MKATFRSIYLVVVTVVVVAMGAHVYSLRKQVASLSEQVKTLSAKPAAVVDDNGTIPTAERVQRLREATRTMEDYLAASRLLMDEKRSKAGSATASTAPKSSPGADRPRSAPPR